MYSTEFTSTLPWIDSTAMYGQAGPAGADKGQATPPEEASVAHAMLYPCSLGEPMTTPPARPLFEKEAHASTEKFVRPGTTDESASMGAATPAEELEASCSCAAKTARMSSTMKWCSSAREKRKFQTKNFKKVTVKHRARADVVIRRG